MKAKKILTGILMGISLWNSALAGAAVAVPVTKPTTNTTQTSGSGNPVNVPVVQGVPVSTAPSKPTNPPPTSQTPFEPKVIIRTAAPKSDPKNTTSFVNGLFVNMPTGGEEQICGLVTNANDLQVVNQSKATIEINGRRFPLDYKAVGTYSFCGDVLIKKQESEVHGVRKNTSDVFNNFEIKLVSKTGGIFKDRYTIVNSASLPSETKSLDEPLHLILNNLGDEGEVIDDYLSHLANDYVLSNEELWTHKFAASFREKFSSCNMEMMYDDATEDEDSWWSQLYMTIFGDIYGLTHDINGNEIMFLCPQDIVIGGSDLTVSVGSTDDEMFVVEGTLSNVQVRFDFEHRFNSSLVYGTNVLEEGTLVINLGKVNISTTMRYLDVKDGEMNGEMLMDDIEISAVNAYWNNWKSYSYFGETTDSGMDEADDIIDEELSDGLTITPEESEKEIDRDLDGDISLDFVPGYIYSNMFALIVEDLPVDVPANLSDDFSAQDDFIYSNNDGFYVLYNDRELGLALDDEMINQQLHFQTKQGKMNQEVTQTLPDGNTIKLTLTNSIAPVATFNGEDSYALRMDLANSKMVITSTKKDIQAEYRLDAAVKIAIATDEEGIMDLSVNSSNITLVEIKTVKAPDKALMDQLIKMAINKMVNEKLEPTLNNTLNDKIDSVLEGTAMDLCTDIVLTDMAGSNNYLTGSLDLIYNESISKSDDCMKAPETDSDLESDTGVTYHACMSNPDNCPE